MALATISVRRLGPLALLAFALTLPSLHSPKAMDHARAGLPAPRLVAPLEGELLVATGARVAVAPAAGTETWILVSETPFTAERLDRLPGDPRIREIRATAPVLDARALGLETGRAATWYWAAAAVDPESGRARITTTRTFRTTPAWTVAAERSPWVTAENRGHDPSLALSGDRGSVLRLAAGYEFDPAAGDLPQAALAAVPVPVGGDDSEALIVQFDHPPTDADRAALLASGAAPISYLPDNAFLVRTLATGRPAVSALDGVRAVLDFAPAFRLSPRIDTVSPETARLVVLFFEDAGLEAHLDAIRALGGSIAVSSDNGINKLAHVDIAANRAADIAALSGVLWVEPFVRPTVGNDLAQWVVQTGVNGSRRVWDQGIDGTGQVVNTTDSGITMAHDQFRDPAVPVTAFGDFPTHRKVIAYKAGSASTSITFGDHSGASFHGTHTGGSIAGNDGPVGGVSLRDGMARGAKIFFQDLSGPALANGIDHFPDLNDLYIVPYLGNAGGAARISSNSWGSNNGGAYDVSCFQVDQFMWAHKDFLIFFSNGNAGAANTVGSPASAKSICSAGGTRNGTLQTSIYTSTSRGPTDDGRRKPTICSPGQSVFSADGNTTPGYKSLSGTSMACPTQAGAAALIRAYLTEGWYPTGTKIPANGFTPSAALLKAMCVCSADNDVTGFTAPDNNIGWGRVNADNVCYFAGDAKKLIAIDNTPGLGQGDFVEYRINVVSSAVPLEVALCWTDYPALPTAAVQLVNNLNLTVTNGISTYRGNVYAGGVSVTGGSSDNLNVEETVLITAPPVGVWTVRIDGITVPYGPQPYGLVMTGGLNDGAGTLYLDRAEYPADGTLELKVVDTNAGPTVTVHVTSPTEPAGEDVVLTGADGVFTGTLRLSPFLPPTPHAPGTLAPLAFDAPDDTLRVSHGDGLTATYQDASPAATLTATATVALERVWITNVGARSEGSGGAAVSWTTDRNASSTVYYGVTPALELGSISDATATFQHEIYVPAGTGQTLYYDVESTGLNGGTTRDDNGGQHYRVTIDRPADILLVIGDSTFDRLEAWEEAFAAAGWSFDVWSGTLAENAALGDTLSGLRSYKAVIWQCGFDQYPPFSDTQRTTVSQYVQGGGRLAVVGHDIAWAFGDPTSPVYSATRSAWLAGTLHTTWQADPTTWSVNFGIAADPISGPYTGGVTYTPIRSGGAGDEINAVAGSGTFNYTWRNNEATADDIGFRWLSNTNNGSPDSAQWGGQPSRLVTMYFEWSAINPPFGTPNATRTDILDRTIIWLLGRDRPDVAFTFPVGGETVTTDTLTVSWTETAYGGTSIGYRRLEYSLDGGDSWALAADSLATSPYAWALGATPNTPALRLRLSVRDDGAPPLAAQTQTATDIALERPGFDVEGPLVVPGSFTAVPNPFVQALPAQLLARLSDVARGGQPVTAAEWSFGAAPAASGTGTPLSGVFGTPTVDVSGSVATKPIAAGEQTFWIRGRDAAGNWGPATSCAIIVNVGEFALARALCPLDSVLTPGLPTPADTLALDLGIWNAGPAADSLVWQVSTVSAGPNVSLIGGPFAGTTLVAAGDTAAITGISATATAGAAPGETLVLKLRTWPQGDPADIDSCIVTLSVRRALALAACPGDTTIMSDAVLPLTFTISNPGNLADSLRWSLSDLGPGPDVALTGGTQSGAALLGPGGPVSLVLPGISVTSAPGAPNDQTTTLRLIVAADGDPAGADTCTVLVTVSNASGTTPISGGPLQFVLLPNHPNPFSASTQVRFQVARPEPVSVRLFALDGQLVRTLIDGPVPAGRHELTWDGVDAQGRAVPAGIYFYRVITASGESASGRMLRVR